MLLWLRRRRTAKAVHAELAEADVQDLLARFGDQAYYVARDRDREERAGGVIDNGRPPRHWSRVKVRIAARSKEHSGLDTATRYLKDR